MCHQARSALSYLVKYKYDFQGGCDQIAIDNPNLQVQIRTRPRGHYSTIVEAVVYFRGTKEEFTYKMKHKSQGGGYVAVNNVKTAANVKKVGNGYQLNINSKNLIKISGSGIGITLEVRGGGGYMFDSVGMCGSWNYGYARFKDGSIFNTSGGYRGTRNTSIKLAKDWQVPIAGSLLTNPTDVCDASSKCGRGQKFACDDVGQAGPVEPGCTEKNCDKVTPKLFREACEDDVALTGDTTYACKYLKEDPLPIYYPKPGDFVPAPTDPAPAAVSSFVWGVNKNDQIFYREGVKGSWKLIGGALKQVSVSDDGQHVWGVNKQDNIWYRNGVNGSWQQINGGLMHVDVNADGTHVWGTSFDSKIWYRTGVKGSWKNISGGLNMVSVSGNGQHIVGCHSSGSIWYRKGVNAASWTQLSGALKHVDVNNDGSQFVGVNKNDDIFYRNGVKASWVKIDGKLKQISTSANGKEIWGVNSADNIWWRPGMTSGNWGSIPGALKYVDVGMK